MGTIIQKNTHYVYKFFGEDEKLLYIGKTNKIERRIFEHSINKLWWPEVQRMEIGATSNSTEASIYEIYYINELGPLYNIVEATHNKLSFSLPEISWQSLPLAEINSIATKKYSLQSKANFATKNEKLERLKRKIEKFEEVLKNPNLPEIVRTQLEDKIIKLKGSYTLSKKKGGRVGTP